MLFGGLKKYILIIVLRPLDILLIFYLLFLVSKDIFSPKGSGQCVKDSLSLTSKTVFQIILIIVITTLKVFPPIYCYYYHRDPQNY